MTSKQTDLTRDSQIEINDLIIIFRLWHNGQTGASDTKGPRFKSRLFFSAKCIERGRSMVGSDGSTKLWRPPKKLALYLFQRHN